MLGCWRQQLFAPRRSFRVIWQPGQEENFSAIRLMCDVNNCPKNWQTTAHTRAIKSEQHVSSYQLMHLQNTRRSNCWNGRTLSFYPTQTERRTLASMLDDDFLTSLGLFSNIRSTSWNIQIWETFSASVFHFRAVLNCLSCLFGNTASAALLRPQHPSSLTDAVLLPPLRFGPSHATLSDVVHFAFNHCEIMQLLLPQEGELKTSVRHRFMVFTTLSLQNYQF